MKVKIKHTFKAEVTVFKVLEVEVPNKKGALDTYLEMDYSDMKNITEDHAFIQIDGYGLYDSLEIKDSVNIEVIK